MMMKDTTTDKEHIHQPKHQPKRPRATLYRLVYLPKLVSLFPVALLSYHDIDFSCSEVPLL